MGQFYQAAVCKKPFLLLIQFELNQKQPSEGDGKSGQDPDKYLICVSDNGCGMEPEELSRITEAFYMVDKARSRKQHGRLQAAVSAESPACSARSAPSASGKGTPDAFLHSRCARTPCGFPLCGQDEIGTLAESFNQMADAVEEKIAELAKAARDKEDFVANFAHELKRACEKRGKNDQKGHAGHHGHQITPQKVLSQGVLL